MMVMELFFLGCGGGRVVLDTQLMPTGGFRLHDEPLRMHVDPGPGAFLKSLSNGLPPRKLNTIFVSHCHLDHVGDLKILIEAMTLDHWGKRYGTVLATRSVIEGDGDFEKEIPEYLKKQLLNCKAFKVGQALPLFEGRITATKTDHEDKSAIGFIYYSQDGTRTVAYTGDTQVFEGLWKQYDLERPLDILVINCLRPGLDRFEYHLAMDEAVAGVKSMKRKPGLVVFSHFGEKMRKAGTAREVARFARKTGVKAVAAKEGLKLSF